MLRRPGPDEYAPYYHTYVGQVPDGPILDLLETGLVATAELLESFPADRHRFAYAPGKWTVLDVVAHMTDTERVFGYRAFAIARGETADIHGMDQELYAANAGATSRALTDCLRELESVRRSNLHLFRSLDDDAWARSGHASGFSFTVRTFPWILAGHEIHHRRVLEERYLGAVPEG